MTFCLTLTRLFQEKEWWVLCYMKDMFSAGMRSTQRFFQQYCKAMVRRSEDEKQADADSARFSHQLVSDFPIERVYQKIYTSAKYLEVQHECMKNLYVSVVGSKEVDDKLVGYTIEDRVWVRDPYTYKDIPTRRKRRYEVKYNMKTNEAWCVCKLMESAGKIYRHIIAVFEENDVENVHDMFILRRWRKD
ncbi:Protein FAR1-RELATED SEQUENCE 5, partial [Bienertia sinuspersici]